MKSSSAHDQILDAVMAGTDAADVALRLARLPITERQEMLCEICAIQNEIACNCVGHGNEVLKLLTSACPLFVDGHATCLE